MENFEYKCVESFGYLIISIVLVSLFIGHIRADIAKYNSRHYLSQNNAFVLMAVKIWSGLFLLIMAGMILWTRRIVTARQLNSFLLISMTGLFIDQSPIFPYIFATISSVSWAEIYWVFLNSPSGLSLNHLLEPKWVLAFYLLSSTVLAGHLQEKLRVQHIKASLFQFACITMIWSSFFPLELLSKLLLPEALPYVAGWAEVPLRLREMEVSPTHCHIVSLASMAVLHASTRYLIGSVDSEEDSAAWRKKTDAEETSCSSAEQECESDVETEESKPADADQQLPADCVEVSEEEALRMCERG